MKTIAYTLLISCIAFTNLAHAISLNSVYENLKFALGDSQRHFPTLQINPEKGDVLTYNPKKNIICIDEAALDICASFGSAEEDALAFLLAHELTHFYQEHNWKTAGFSSRFLLEKDTYKQHIVDEKEADLFGAFLTHLAGYQSIKIVPEIFDRVYQSYGLNENLSNYPSLSERKKVAAEVCKKVSELIDLFETANHLVAINEPLMAAAAYEHILKFVKYKELYKNAGTALVAAAANEKVYGETHYFYPLELDFNIPLRDGAVADRKALLQKAIQHLSIATQMDNQDFANFFNLCSAYVLNKQFRDANQLLTNLSRLNTNNAQQAKTEILKGILSAKQDNKKVAEATFQNIKTSSSVEHIEQIATLNLAALQGKNIEQTSPPFHPSTEQIGGIDLAYQNDFNFEELRVENRYTQEENIFASYQTSTAKLSHISGYSNTIAILSTNKQNVTTSDGFGIGTAFVSIQKEYPDGRILNHSRGYYFILPQRKLFFSFKQNNKVYTWGTYERY